MSDEILAPARRPQLLDMLFTHFMQTVFDIVLNLFFSKMEILGRDNFPRYGPTIVVGNHNNQFADGILLTSKCYDLAREVWTTDILRCAYSVPKRGMLTMFVRLNLF